MGGGIAAGGGGLAVLVGIVYFLLTGDASGVQVGGDPAGGGGPPAAGAPGGTATDEEAVFAETVLAYTEDAWNAIFREAGQAYREPTMVFFDDYVSSACGSASSAVGPFYCPGDERVYIDLRFFRDLDRQLGAPGDFAQAYVIAHEVGHHVQKLTGVAQQVNAASRRVSQEEANRLSVMQELQADCYAGVWAARTQAVANVLEPGDVEEALDAAAAIGDDTLQRRGQGHVVPETFTHGTSAQRQRWFRRGLETGDAEQCDTFNAASL